MITVHTDGACAPTNPGPCAWGAVVIHESGEVSEHCGFIGQGTNQVAEITAALKGLLLTPVGSSVELVSDSQYVLKGISEWRAGWERNGWRNSKKEPVANLEHWKLLFSAVDERIVQVRWVKGHNGDQHNEMADQMATKGLTMSDYVENAPSARVVLSAFERITQACDLIAAQEIAVLGSLSAALLQAGDPVSASIVIAARSRIGLALKELKNGAAEHDVLAQEPLAARPRMRQ